jgi:uncharacterized protein YxeA
MKRSIKNIINIALIVVMIVASGLTFYYSKTQATGQSDIQMSQSNNMQGDSSSSAPEMPSGDNQNSEEPPEIPSGDTSDTQSMPNSQSGDSGSSQTPPDKPDGGDSSEQSSGQDMQMPSGDNSQMQNENNSNNKNIVFYIVFGIENLILAMAIMYLIMSKANKLGIKGTFKNCDKIVIYILSIIIIIASLTTADGIVLNKLNSTSNNEQSQSQSEMNNDSSASADATGATEVEDEQELSSTYSTTNADESSILVKNGGELTLTNATVTKSGDSSNTENSEFYGINAGLLVTENSTATISGATITTDATGSNAVFATGTDAKIYISDSTINTTGESSARGLDATYGGYIEGDSLKITTQGGSCASLATDRGEGTVTVKNSTLETNGSGSPVIYSTGDISISKTIGTANNAQMVVVEGKNSATVEDSTLTCSGAGNRNDVDNAGIMIYQSMSGDASEGTGNFTAKNSKLTIDSNSDYYKTAPMFFITNTDAIINLESTTLEFGSNVLISAQGTSEWGNSGSNGGNITLNATSQNLNGDIELDELSSLEMNLTSSSYEGTINADNSAKSIDITLDEDSTLTLTSDSYITSLSNADTSNSNINLNGYKLYVDGNELD